MPTRQELITRLKQIDVERNHIIRNSFDDERDEGTKATFGGLVKQMVLGGINSALLGFPQFLIDREAEGVFRPSTSKAERVARGTGTAAGFVLGGPGKVLVKGGKVGAKVFGNIGRRVAIKKGLKFGTKESIKTVSRVKAAGAGATAFGALDVLSAPERSYEEKLITTPLSIALGGAFGLAEPMVERAIRGGAQKITKTLFRNGKKADIEAATTGIVENIKKTAVNTDKAYIKLLKSNQFGKANDFVNLAYAGARQKIARARLKLANMETFKGNRGFQEAMRSGNAQEIAEAQLKNIVSKKNIPLEVHEGLKQVASAIRTNSFTTSAGVQLARMGGGAREIARRGFVARDNGGRLSGKLIADFRLITKGLRPAEMENLRAVIEGRATPLNNRVFMASSNVSGLFNDIAKRAGKNIKQFRSVRKNYFPRIQIDPKSAKNVVDETLQAAVKRGEFGPGKGAMKRARKAWGEYADMMAKNDTTDIDGIVRYLVDTKQVTGNTMKEKRQAALNLINQVDKFGNTYKDRIIKPGFGNLEAPRGENVQFPFYDPNTARTAERYLYGSGTRLSEIEQFGSKFEIYDALMAKAVKENPNNQRFLLELRQRFLGTSDLRNAFVGISPQASQTIRAVQTITKLGLAAIPNATQSVNTLMATNVQSTGQAIKKSLSGKTKVEAAEFALRTGATLEGTIREYIKGLGLDGSFELLGKRVSATKFLEKTGFVWIENMNRIIAANAGKQYSLDMGARLVRSPKDKLARRALKMMKIDPEKILKAGFIGEEDMLKAGQHIVNKTQFRSGPLDLPLFFTSPEGKLMTQFKSFAFNQAKLMKDLVLEEAARGNMAPLIQGIAIMPILGEGVKDVRGILTGQVRDQKGLERLADNFSSVGGVGILNDMWNAATFNNIEGALGGPTFSDISKLLEGSQRAIKGKPQTLQRHLLRQIPVVGQKIANTVAPSTRLRRLRDKRKRERAKARGK